jgi:ankyrin repeat protein
MATQRFLSAIGTAMLAVVLGTAFARSDVIAAKSDPTSLAPIGEFSALHDAVRRDNSARVRILLAGGANVNERDALGRAPLHYAARLGYIEIVQLLVDAEAQIDVADNEGFTPLMRAIQGGHSAVVTVLLQRGANIGAKTNTGATALDFATSMGDKKILEQLR